MLTNSIGQPEHRTAVIQTPFYWNDILCRTSDSARPQQVDNVDVVPQVR